VPLSVYFATRRKPPAQSTSRQLEPERTKAIGVNHACGNESASKR
jgi:hypothetical protein